MDPNNQASYLQILKSELLTAMGCTEPIAIAYAAALAAHLLNEPVESVHIACSGNLIKNAKGVVVPHTGGLRGINSAASIGVFCAEPQRQLALLDGVTAEQIAQAQAFLAEERASFSLVPQRAGLYILATAKSASHEASVEIDQTHTNVTRCCLDGRELPQECAQIRPQEAPDYSKLNVADVLAFAQEAPLELLRPLLEHQVVLNRAIAEEGLQQSWGAGIGRSIMRLYDPADVRTRARAYAAAGSDARMSGCALPVVINSGSGNQGITASMPVIVYAEHIGASELQLYRALALSNLLAIHQKRFIGSLSAFCGAVSAATGAAAAITWLQGGGYEQIAQTITNSLATTGGIVCDGAKPSCAAKIASALEAALLGSELGLQGAGFKAGEGLVGQNVEETIRNFGQVARDGMFETDQQILGIMRENC